MTARAALGASLLAVLATPATWLLGLLSFLLRGGIVLAVLPIVTVPSVVGLGNVLGPALTDLVLGDTRTVLLVAAGGTALIAAVWLGLGGWVAAAAEAEAIRLVVADEEVGGDRPAVPARSVAGRILVARLVAWLPLFIAAVVGTARLVLVSYRELTAPSTGGPLVLRVALGSIDALFLIILAWLVGEIVGALTARHLALHGVSIGGALRRGVVDLVRHPITVLAAALVPLLALVAVAIPSAAATGSAWGALRTTLADDAGPLIQAAFVVLLVILWLGALVLIGLASAWRGAVWTVLVARTFGGVAPTRPGEWSEPDAHGTLTDLRSDDADRDPR